jgi:hypothetical protein
VCDKGYLTAVRTPFSSKDANAHGKLSGNKKRKIMVQKAEGAVEFNPADVQK